MLRILVILSQILLPASLFLVPVYMVQSSFRIKAESELVTPLLNIAVAIIVLTPLIAFIYIVRSEPLQRTASSFAATDDTKGQGFALNRRTLLKLLRLFVMALQIGLISLLVYSFVWSQNIDNNSDIMETAGFIVKWGRTLLPIAIVASLVYVLLSKPIEANLRKE